MKSLVGAAALAMIVSGASAPPAAAGSKSPLDLAREAAQAASFSGVIDVVWQDGKVQRHQQLTVKAAGGVLLFGGPTPLMALEQTRLVRHNAAWDVLWPAAFGRLRRPDSAEKYDRRVSVGPVLLGYPTLMIDIRRGAQVRERLYVEQISGLLLRREQFDERGRLQRSMGFEKLKVDASAAPLARPVSTKTEAGRSVAAQDLHGPYSAPTELGDGYRRTGLFRRHDVVQVVYSDGIYDLSIFEQRGRLGSKAVPRGGRKVQIGTSKGWHYTWPGGQVILWQAGRTVYTVVADAPYDDVVKAIRNVRGSSGVSLVQRFRQACRSLVGGLGND